MYQLRKKICMLGSFAVGKTSLVRRFVEGNFEPTYRSTLGVHVSRKPVSIGATHLDLIVCDLTGDEHFTGTQEHYLLGVDGGMIVCDLTRPETLEAWRRYTTRLRAVNPYAACVLVANKSDLTKQQAIDEAELHNMAESLGAPFFLTSAKTGENVEEAFMALVHQTLKRTPVLL